MLILLDAYFKIAVLSSYVRFEGIVKLFKIEKTFNISYYYNSIKYSNI